MKLQDKIKQKLTEKGYKLTPQREMVYEIFFNNSDKYLSASEIYDRVRKKTKKAGLTTVYRTIELLSAVELIEKMPIVADESYYIISSDGHKHHIVCTNCRCVMEIDNCVMKEMGEQITNET